MLPAQDIPSFARAARLWRLNPPHPVRFSIILDRLIDRSINRLTFSRTQHRHRARDGRGGGGKRYRLSNPVVSPPSASASITTTASSGTDMEHQPAAATDPGNPLARILATGQAVVLNDGGMGTLLEELLGEPLDRLLW